MSSTVISSALSANTVTITDVPANVVKAEVTGSDTNHYSITTEATATLSSGKAKIEKITDAGYYYVTFYTEEAEVGIATFFIGESGQSYAYGYEDGMEEKYTKTNTIKYEAYPTVRILDISGSNAVTFNDVDDSVVNATVYVSYENGDYGNMDSKVNVKNGTTTINNIGGKGEYSITFSDAEETILNYAAFSINEKNELLVYDYVIDDATGEWIQKPVPAEAVSVEEYNDQMIGIGATEDEVIESHSVTISGVSGSVKRVEIQGVDLELEPMVVDAAVSLSSGSVEIGSLYTGCYFVNFYNASEDVIGFSKFYIDNEGKLYDFDFIDNEPQLSPVSSIKYSSIAVEPEYQFGNITVSIYDVPKEVDHIECYYIYGDSTDETILFEPEYSSVTVSPFKISKLGQSGNYKVSFFRDGNVIGNATFAINESGKICETEYVYNDKTDKWETSLAESDEIYYFENTDIEDADDYVYGSTKLSITNLPANAKKVVSYYYGEDDTFTYGERFFPNAKISNGVATITNLGQPGYYQFIVSNDDETNNIGYTSVYVDDTMTTYLYETSINSDIMEIEVNTTKTNTIKLSQYVSGYVDYQNGNNSVEVKNVPNIVNSILVTVIGEDGYYSSFEREIVIEADQVAKIDKLGMNGEYTVVFMVGNDVVGTSRFYLKDGKLYNAEYSGDYELTLKNAQTIAFIPSDDAVEFTKGDVDLNGIVSIADVVLLQKYIHKTQSINPSQFNIADINEDGMVDVFDLGILKRKFMQSQPTA